MFSHALLAVALLFHAGQQPFSFKAQQLTAQLAVKSSAIGGLVWYPVDASAPERVQTIGAPGHALFIAGSAAPGARLASSPKRFPLILLSHGTGGSARQLAWLGTALARAGFIAVAIDHPGNNGVADPTVQGFTLWWLRARELSMALDTVLANPAFGPRIDKTRIGAAGFSLGGYTVIAIAGARVDMPGMLERCTSDPQAMECQSPPEFPDLVAKAQALRASDPSYANALANGNVNVADPRVRAIYAIAPALGEAVTLDSLHDVAIPVRIAYGTSDRIAPPPQNALRYANWIPGAATLPVLDAGHYTFLDTCTAAAVQSIPAICVDPAGIDRNAVHARVAADAVDFFRQTLT
jgi:predicted dienelactone hydrolase